MGNLGEISEIINGTEVQLKVGTNVYILLTDLNLHIGRTEERTPTTDGGVLYTYGKGDHWFTCTLIATDEEMDAFSAANELDASGDMGAGSTTAFTIVATNVSGGTATFTCTGYIRDIDIKKAPEGKVMCDLFVRIIGDTVAVTVV